MVQYQRFSEHQELTVNTREFSVSDEHCALTFKLEDYKRSLHIANKVHVFDLQQRLIKFSEQEKKWNKNNKKKMNYAWEIECLSLN